MKKSILIAGFFIGTYAFAQTAEQRAVIQQSINKTELSGIQIKFEKNYQLQQQKITAYLAANKGAARTFTKGGSLYMLHHIDETGTPIYINTKDINQVANSKSNALYSGGSVGVNITGTNMVAGVWDGGQVNSNHELLIGRAVMQPNQPKDTITGNDHMQAVTGIMVGRILTSSSNPNGTSARGIAPNATTQNFDWDDDLTEMAGFAANGYLISNHSYGAANTQTANISNYGAYDSSAKAWDALLKTTPNYLPFVAAGNEQQANGNSGAGGFDIITGSSAAKNVMTVGAIELNNSMSNYSNWGPTDDGRVKPDIVTLGSNINAPLYTGNTSYTGTVASSSGTSYSAPAAAAAGLLLQQYYYSIFGKYMKAASLKALMLHTADDAGNPGPDAKFGWGILNVEKAAQTIKQMQSGGSAILVEYTTNSIPASQQNVSFNGSGTPVRASVCWTDDDGTEQTAADGVNNTSSRLVYTFDLLLRQASPFIDVYTYRALSVANPNALAVVGTGLFQNTVDNYRQANISNATVNANMAVYTLKSNASPTTVKPYSVLITGAKITNATLATSDNTKSQNTVFYNAVDSKIKMISSNAKDGFGEYTIYDMSGKVVQSGKEKSNEISFLKTVKGVYLLSYKNKTETLKFRN